ncbi:unnamed protein product, partial [Prorocentrum cordatum]
ATTPSGASSSAADLTTAQRQIMIAHVPTAVAPYEERQAFWTELETELGKVNHPSRLLVFIDANDDDGVNGCNAKCYFSAELKEAFALTDVAEWHDCTEPTWFGNSLFPKRSDHIWVTDWWLWKSVAAGVEQDPMVFTTRDVWASMLGDPEVYHAELIRVVQRLQEAHFFSEATQAKLRYFLQAWQHSITEDSESRVRFAHLGGSVRSVPCVMNMADMRRLNPKKNLGPDGIGISVWRAGDEVSLDAFLPLFDLSASRCQLPVSMKGGKGRSNLVSDHLSKLYTMQISDPVYQVLQDAVGDAQCGAVPGRDTLLLTVGLQTFAERAVRMRQCWAILFFDLAKAFDSVIREYLYAAGHRQLHVLADQLHDLGIPRDVADKAQRHLQNNPSLLRAAGMDEHATARAADLHSGMWFQVRGERGPVVAANRGARQGCRLGAVRFNIAYELALKRVRHRFQESGIQLSMNMSTHASVPWATDFDSSPDHVTLQQAPNDEQYVDDVTFEFLADSPQESLAQVDPAVDIITEEFRRVGFVINVGPGKSAIMARMYGQGSRATWRTCVLSMGRSVDRSPAGLELEVVHDFPHLGATLQASGQHILDAKQKTPKAQQTYAPLAVHIFGCNSLRCSTRSTVATSSVFSKSHYGISAWRGDDPQAMAIMNGQYHRVLRRISGDMRYGAPDTATDEEVRQKVHAPLLASMVRARRLSQLASHFPTAPKVVQMMVEALPKPPSAQMLLYDLEQFAVAFPDVGQKLGSPSAHPEKWKAYIVESPRRLKSQAALM